MIFLYTALLAALGVCHWLFKRRASTLERKYARVSRQADEVLRQLNLRPGIGNRPDTCEAAKRQYRLALLATRRDKVEGRYTRAQSRADRLAKLRNRLRAWKGRTLPYTFGVLDVTGALALVDYLGAGRLVNARGLLHAVQTFFGH
jgi:hypothetical protein